MADQNALNKVVRQFIREILGEDENFMRPANQNAPAGAQDDEYGTVLITIFNDVGLGDESHKDVASPSTNVLYSVKGQCVFTASVQFFRGAAYNRATRLKKLLQHPVAVEKMQVLGLGYVKASTAQNLTQVVDTFWEARGKIDVDFYVVSEEALEIASYREFPISISTETATSNFEVFEP
jgi:hypothetical protein